MDGSTAASGSAHPQRWYEVAQELYRKRRYLRHFTDEQLAERARDVFLNLTDLTKDCKIGLSESVRERRYWLLLWSDLLEEYNLRFGGMVADKDFMTRLRIPRPDSDRAKRAAHLVQSLARDHGTSLIKYGKAQHLRPMLDTGLIRIQPASFYEDPSLNYAIQADELKLVTQPPPWALRLETIDGTERRQLAPIDNRLTIESTTDYFVVCVSGVLSPRLFVDFDADSCLIIKEPLTFVKRVQAAFAKKFTGYDPDAFPVFYCDPIDPAGIDLHPMVAKHFRYTYQKEFRIIWTPREPRARLTEAVFLEAGSLTDICDLHLI